MKKNITMAIATIALLLSGNNTYQGAFLSSDNEESFNIELDSINPEGIQTGSVWRVGYMKPVLYTIEKRGLPSYDSISINEPFYKNTVMKGAEFDSEEFLRKTYGAVRVLDWKRLK